MHYTASLGIPALRQAISAYYAERFGVDVPVECFRIAERQTQLRSSVRAVTVESPSQVSVRAWAFIENLDLADRSPTVRAYAVRAGTDDVELMVRTGTDDAMKPERRLFKYSILYLFAMFGALVVDRWLA